MLKIKDLIENFEYPDAKMIEIEGENIYIKQYLPADQKYSLIYIVLTALSLDSQGYDALSAEALFDIEVVKHYSSINFDEEGTISYFKIFDVLDSKGIIDKVVSEIPIDEYEKLQRLFQENVQSNIEHYHSLGYVVSQIIGQLPSIGEEIEKFDHESYEQGIEMIDKLVKEKHI